jgi:uncharacterized membrane protein
MRKKRWQKRIWIVGVAGTSIVVLLLSAAAMRPRCRPVSGADRITVSLAQLARGAVEFLCYRDSAGERIRFILARDQDGTVHSALDACRQCYSFHKGYTVSHGQLICRLCGNRYGISQMEHGKASCVPIKLPNKQHRDLVEVKVSDLTKEAALF